MKILVLGTSHTFGRCKPEGDIIPEKRWAKLVANSCNAELTTLSMSGATFQQQAHIAFRYLEDTKQKFDLCIIEGRHVGWHDASYPEPKAKGNTRLEDFDTQEHELIYEPWLTDKKMVQRDRLLPFINISDVEGSNYFNEYVYSPLHWTDCYFVNLGLIRYLEKHCKIVKWFSLGYSKKVPKHYIDWGYELLKDNAIGWPYIPIIGDQCGCGHPNEQGHKNIADEVYKLLKEEKCL